MEDTKMNKQENEIIMNTKYGNKVKIIFAEDDNKDIVNIVLDNLMISYESRIGA